MQVKSVDTAHTDAIHDVKIDPSGALLASSSSDATIRITDAAGNRVLDVLHGHDSAVWSLSWAPQVYGVMLASGSYCGKLCVWSSRSLAAVKFEKIYEYVHGSSVNCVAWAPAEAGHLVLVAGCSDGVIVVLTQSRDNPADFDVERIVGAHGIACAAVSWAPRGNEFVSGGFDNQIKIWRRDDGAWAETNALSDHAGWVRDVQWNPVSPDVLASCSDDGTVRIWESSPGARDAWSPRKIDFSAKGTPWHVSWSLCGTILAVSCGEGSVSLWRKATDGVGDWIQLPRGGAGITDSEKSAELVAQL